jgi:AcrR family transcriptional regulator
MEQTGGLRERKKLATRRAIVSAALELFDERGFHATSIPAIAEAAEVSPRSVSHYFPHKEHILFAEDLARTLRLEQWLRNRDPSHTTADAFRAWLEAELPSALDLDRDEHLRRRRIIDADLDLQAAERRYLAGAEHALAEAFATDPSAPSPLHARLTAAALLAMLGVVVAEGDARLAAEPDWDTSQAVQLLDDALRFVEAGLHELQPRAARTGATPDAETKGS